MSEPCPHHARLEAKVDQILLCIVGDDRLGHRGIIPRLSTVEDKQDQFSALHTAEINQKKGMWAVLKTEKAIVAAGITLGGSLGFGFAEIIKLFHK